MRARSRRVERAPASGNNKGLRLGLARAWGTVGARSRRAPGHRRLVIEGCRVSGCTVWRCIYALHCSSYPSPRSHPPTHMFTHTYSSASECSADGEEPAEAAFPNLAAALAAIIVAPSARTLGRQLGDHGPDHGAPALHIAVDV